MHFEVESAKDLPPQPKPDTEEEKKTVTYQRGKAKKNTLEGSPENSGLRFDKDVPVKEIILNPPELEGEESDDYELIRYEHTYRLAQKPVSHVVLKYTRSVIKKKST